MKLSVEPGVRVGSGLYDCSVDPFTKKDWYDVKAPAVFSVRNVGKTLVTRTQGKSKSYQQTMHAVTAHCA